MSELSGGERREPEIVRVLITIDDEHLQSIRENVASQRKLIEAAKLLVKAGRQILEVEDVYGIEQDVEQWERGIPEGTVVNDDDFIVCSGAQVRFDSGHPALVTANQHKYNFHVDAFSLTNTRVVISGQGEFFEDPKSRELEPVSMFGCVIDTTQPVQEADIHILRFTRKVWDRESDEEKELVAGLIRDLDKLVPTST